MKTTKNILSIFFCVLVAFSLNSCMQEESVNVNQDRIFTEYELFYDGNEDKTYAKAKFKFGNITGTVLKLSSPSEVTFNGDILTHQGALGHYEKQYAGKVLSGTFKWKDTEGKTFENTIAIKNSIEFPAIDTINSASSYDLKWVGTALEDKESVYMAVNGINEGDAQIFTQNNVGSTNIILSANQLQKLAKGKIDMLMDRQYIPDLQQKTAVGGLFISKYRAKNKSVQLK